MSLPSPIPRVEREVLCDFTFPAIAVREELVLVVEKLFARLGGVREVRSLDDGVDRAGLLAEAAIDALRHVDVVAGRPARAVVAARARLDRDRLGGADRFAELTGDAAFLTIRIAAQRVLAAEARREQTLFVGIVQRLLRREEVAHRQEEGRDELGQEERLYALRHVHESRPPNCSTAAVMMTMTSDRGRNTFQPRRVSWS